MTDKWDRVLRQQNEQSQLDHEREMRRIGEQDRARQREIKREDAQREANHRREARRVEEQDRARQREIKREDAQRKSENERERQSLENKQATRQKEIQKEQAASVQQQYNGNGRPVVRVLYVNPLFNDIDQNGYGSTDQAIEYAVEDIEAWRRAQAATPISHALGYGSEIKYRSVTLDECRRVYAPQYSRAAQNQMKELTREEMAAIEKRKKAAEEFNKPRDWHQETAQGVAQLATMAATRGIPGGLKTAVSVTGGVGFGASIGAQVSNRDDVALYDLTTVEGWKKLDLTDATIAGIANAGAAAAPAGRGLAGTGRQILGQVLVQEVGYVSQNTVNKAQGQGGEMSKGGFAAVALTTGTGYAISKFGGRVLKEKKILVRDSAHVKNHGVLLTPLKEKKIKSGLSNKVADELLGVIGSTQQELLTNPIGNKIDTKMDKQK